jgi:hypothetical protein
MEGRPPARRHLTRLRTTPGELAMRHLTSTLGSKGSLPETPSSRETEMSFQPSRIRAGSVRHFTAYARSCRIAICHYDGASPGRMCRLLGAYGDVVAVDAYLCRPRTAQPECSQYLRLHGRDGAAAGGASVLVVTHTEALDDPRGTGPPSGAEG